MSYSLIHAIKMLHFSLGNKYYHNHRTHNIFKVSGESWIHIRLNSYSAKAVIKAYLYKDMNL